MKRVEEVVKKFFPENFSDKERAIFEAGIALGAITHTVCGFPVTLSMRRFIEKAVEKSFMLQPYRKRVRLRIVGLKKRGGLYRYGTVTPNDLEILVKVEYGRTVVTAQMRYLKELNYPLMYVSRIIQKKDGPSPHPYIWTQRIKARRKASNVRG